MSAGWIRKLIWFDLHQITATNSIQFALQHTRSTFVAFENCVCANCRIFLFYQESMAEDYPGQGPLLYLCEKCVPCSGPKHANRFTRSAILGNSSAFPRGGKTRKRRVLSSLCMRSCSGLLLFPVIAYSPSWSRLFWLQRLINRSLCCWLMYLCLTHKTQEVPRRADCKTEPVP